MSTNSVDTKDKSHFSKFDTRLCASIQLKVHLTAGGIRFTLTSCIATKQQYRLTMLRNSHLLNPTHWRCSQCLFQATSFVFLTCVLGRRKKVVGMYSISQYSLLTNTVVTVGVLPHTRCCSFLNPGYHVVTLLLCFVLLSLEKEPHKADHV